MLNKNNTKESITFSTIYQAYKRNFYIWHSEPCRLNLFGIRKLRYMNTFDDIFGFCYIEHGAHVFQCFDCTTDPGESVLKTPENCKGTAILVPGQYIDTWTTGLHKGYSAFVQHKEVKVYRDNNKNEELDIDPSSIDIGFFGINIHRASSNMKSTNVNNWSAGCQVLADPNDFKILLKARDKAKRNNWPWFSYTLFTEEQFFG